MMRRFERIYDVVEPRYRIIGKLAYGQFSTVWFAHDQLLERQVALNILKADASENNQELATYLRLSALNRNHPGQRHVLELLDHFKHDGPNGTHLCLVLPVMISDGKEMTVTGRPRNATYVRMISRQLLLGLNFLHSLNLVHCDLQPANIMISLNCDTRGEILLEPSEFSPVQWLDEDAVDDNAPKYLITTQRRRGQLDGAEYSELVVKIGDLGGALRAPELIHGEAWDSGIDIWALGCLIFELATNEPLFPLGTFGLSREEIDEEHLHLISRLLGNDGRLNETFIRHLMDRLPAEFGAANVEAFASERRSAARLLDHPF
ncbi:kinase-like domain-containing protein [Aspergillus carlsbadensis]|nr:kinase-like domain-containing protein [Aspergillus carlsbadensis]